MQNAAPSPTLAFAPEVTEMQAYPAYTPTGPIADGIVLLEASAGTGKTYSIADLYLRLVVERDLPVAAILVVTFTKAATAELRDRVRKRLVHAQAELARAAAEPAFDGAVGDPVLRHLIRLGRAGGQLGTFVQQLARAREALDVAAIFTIHGFCQRMLQRNAFESGVEFDVDLIADERALLAELADDFLVRRLRDASVHEVRLLREAGIDRKNLLKLGDLLLRHPGVNIEPEAATGTLAEALADWQAAAAPLAAAWRENGVNVVACLVAAVERKDLSGTTCKAATTQKHAAVLDAWFADGSVPAGAALDSLRWFTPAKMQASTAKGKTTPTHPLLPRCQTLLDRLPALLAALDGFLPAFCRWLQEDLDRRKSARQLQSYSDLLVKLQQALAGRSGAALRAAIRGPFRAALIDEFQDTDPIQWAIFRKVFGEPVATMPEFGTDLELATEPGLPLYLIGDPKQAIYGFRGADLDTYLDARAAAEAGRFTLDTNWRSDAPLVTAVQHLFDGPLAFADPRIDRPVITAAHVRSRLKAGATVVHESPPQPLTLALSGLHLRFLTTARTRHTLGDPDADATGEPDPQAEPRNVDETRSAILSHVAQEIAQFLNARPTRQPHADGPTLPLTPGDIAVLVQTNDQARAVQAALARVGLPAVVSSDGDVFESATADTFGRLLAALADPTDHGALCALLASPLLGLDAAVIARLDTEDGLREAWDQRRRTWHSAWIDKGFLHMARMVLAAPVAVDPLSPSEAPVTIPERLLVLPNGERRLTDLLHLVELTWAAVSSAGLHPGGTVAWFAAERTRDKDDVRELRLETDAAAVQVVTVHKSKGLQYPCVWCPYAWAGERKPNSHHLLFHDPDRGGAATLDLRLDADAEPKATHLEIAALEQLAERLRQLYVALTRAEHRTVAYLGHLKGYETSALAWLLHRRHVQPADATPAAMREAIVGYLKANTKANRPGRNEAELFDDVRDAVAGCADITLSLVPACEPDAVWVKPTTAQVQLAARRFDRPGLDRWWRRTSYSAMTKGKDADGRDERRQQENSDLLTDDALEAAELLPEAEVPDAIDPPMPADAADVPLADLKGGKDLGTFLHAVLELHDFALPATDPSLRGLVAAQARSHGLRYSEATASALVAGLETVLDTPLGPQVGGLNLRNLQRKHRLDELDFDFPLVGADGGEGVVTSRQLAAVLRAHRGPGSPLTDAYLERVARLRFFPPLRGFMNGSIDLVFRATVPGATRPKWFLADYKSNWLGTVVDEQRRCTPWHYRPQRLHAAMEHAHYFLQYHVYTVALHRWLGWRLPGYDYDTDFGGCLYLFLRGMTGLAASGVWFDRPPAKLIHELSGLFGKGGGA